MRDQVINYYNKNNQKEFPDIGIVFVGNRAIVSLRSNKNSPIGHVEVFYGAFFFIRLAIACAKVFKENI